MILSVPTWAMDVTRLVLRYLRSRATKGVGTAAVVLAKAVRWHRKPESTSSDCLLSGFANLNRKIFYV